MIQSFTLLLNLIDVHKSELDEKDALIGQLKAKIAERDSRIQQLEAELAASNVK